MSEITPLTERQKTLIVNNIVAAVKDIEKLNKTGYNFIYLASGFIAHYNLHGFRHYYSQWSLRNDIINNANYNMWSNFRKGEKNYDYYMSKRDVYQRILAKI
jgi:hypothetical protein